MPFMPKRINKIQDDEYSILKTTTDLKNSNLENKTNESKDIMLEWKTFNKNETKIHSYNIENIFDSRNNIESIFKREEIDNTTNEKIVTNQGEDLKDKEPMRSVNEETSKRVKVDEDNFLKNIMKNNISLQRYNKVEMKLMEEDNNKSSTNKNSKFVDKSIRKEDVEKSNAFCKNTNYLNLMTCNGTENFSNVDKKKCTEDEKEGTKEYHEDELEKKEIGTVDKSNLKNIEISEHNQEISGRNVNSLVYDKIETLVGQAKKNSESKYQENIEYLESELSTKIKLLENLKKEVHNLNKLINFKDIEIQMYKKKTERRGLDFDIDLCIFDRGKNIIKEVREEFKVRESEYKDQLCKELEKNTSLKLEVNSLKKIISKLIKKVKKQC